MAVKIPVRFHQEPPNWGLGIYRGPNGTTVMFWRWVFDFDRET